VPIGWDNEVFHAASRGRYARVASRLYPQQGISQHLAGGIGLPIMGLDAGVRKKRNGIAQCVDHGWILVLNPPCSPDRRFWSSFWAPAQCGAPHNGAVDNGFIVRMAARISNTFFPRTPAQREIGVKLYRIAEAFRRSRQGMPARLPVKQRSTNSRLSWQ